MFAVLLAFAGATTTIGPELVERFTLNEARGPFAIGVNEVLVAQEGNVLERRALDGKVNARIELPCTPIDVAAGERAWAVLCADRIVMERARFSNEVARQTVDLAPQSAPPSLLAVQPFHGAWIVAYEDGLVQRGRFPDPVASVVDEIDLRGQPMSLVLTGINDGTIALADGSQHAWRGSLVEDVTSTLPARALVELYDDANGAKHARVTRHVLSGAPTALHTKHGAFAVSSSRAIDALDVAYSDDVVCARARGGQGRPPHPEDPEDPEGAVRSGAALTCYAIAPALREIAPRAVDDDTAPIEMPRENVDEEFEPPLDFGTPGAIAALVSTALGIGSFASAPFAMHALSPSLGLAPAFALAGLGAIAGVASFAVVASAVIVVGAIIVAAMPDESSSANAGVCAPGVQMLEGAINDCICAIATIVGIVGAVVAVASIGVAAFAVASMSPVDTALTGRAPANDPFFATWAGAAAGSVVGFGVGAGISLLTTPLRDGADDDLEGGGDPYGEPDDDLAVVLDKVQTFAFVVGGSAIGASIGYGVARGP